MPNKFVQFLSCVWLYVTPQTSAHQATLLFTTSQSLLKLASIELLMPFNHLVFCCPLIVLTSIFPSIRVFSRESALHIRWPKYWSFSFSISLSNEYSGFISFRIDWLDLAFQETLKFSPAPQNGTELYILLNLFLKTRSLLSNWMVRGLS